MLNFQEKFFWDQHKGESPDPVLPRRPHTGLYKPPHHRDNAAMRFHLSLFVAALGLACVLESLPWLLAPDRMREVLRHLERLPAEKLRVWGFLLLGIGLILVSLSRL